MNNPKSNIDKIPLTVFGAGSFGTALSVLLAFKGYSIKLWAYEREVAEEINRNHRNPLYMTAVPLPNRIVATHIVQEAIDETQLILFVVPAQHVRSVLKRVRSMLPNSIPIVNGAKGIECETLFTMEQVFGDELTEEQNTSYCVLSGPSFADEIIKRMPTNVTAASRRLECAKQVQSMMSTREFRVYTTDDVTGVEIGGALKNLIAIVIGASDEMGLGHNTRAALITRGLAEITRLAVHLGGRPETLLGLAGVGDLVMTCTGDLSRNRTVGKLLAQGYTRQEIQDRMTMIAEGIDTCVSAYRLGQDHHIDLPITEQLYEVLYKEKRVDQAMKSLQDRSLKDEWSTD